MKTRVAELLGIRCRIIAGGMQWIGKAELASAVFCADAKARRRVVSQWTTPMIAPHITHVVLGC